MCKVLSVIIPIYNRIDVTRNGLNKLNESIEIFRNHNGTKGINIKVVVIDDGSTDGSYDFIRKNHPTYSLLKGDGNLWWSGAVNKGAAYAINNLNTDFLLLWNDDTQPAKNYFIKIAELIDIINNKPIIVGSKILDAKTESVWSAGGKFNSITGRRYMMKSIPAEVDDNNLYAVDWLPAMGTIIPEQVIKKIGYWDKETFPQYHGDADFTLRAKRAGFTICVYPMLIIYNDTVHSSYVANSFKQLRYSLAQTNSRFNIKKNILFYRRHARTPLWFLPMFKNYMKMLFRLIRVQFWTSAIYQRKKK